MSSIKLFIITVLSLSLWTCGDNPNGKKNHFVIKTDAKNNTIALGETVNLSMDNPKNKTITNVTYHLNGVAIDKNFTTTDVPLGIHTLTAKVVYEGQTEETTTNLTVLNNKPPVIYSYNILNEYPHDITSYTQGLEFHNGILYESTGQYGESKLRKVKHDTGEILKSITIGNQYFGEGLTVLNDKIYQLTWKENIGFVYNAETLEKTGSFNYGKSKEGWGLCNDGKTIYKSDGTHTIWKLNPETLAEEGFIQVFTNTGKIESLNELEYINGKIYANIYQRNGVLIINPKNGAVEGVIDFSPLQKLVKQHPELDVLNGIAYNPDTKTIFVTGKNWDKLFEVEVFVK